MFLTQKRLSKCSYLLMLRFFQMSYHSHCDFRNLSTPSTSIHPHWPSCLLSDTQHCQTKVQLLSIASIHVISRPSIHVITS